VNKSWYPPPSRPRPVEGGLKARSARGAIARTWWSERFIAVLEDIGLGNRLQRGRTYARKGQVISLEVDPGSVTAEVQGSRARPYRIRIGIPAFGKSEWAHVERSLAENAWYTAKLLSGETGDRWPSMLPDGNHFVFWVRGDKSGICVGSLDSLEHTFLFENVSNAVYAAPGYLLFVKDQSLMAQPFSASGLEPRGEATPVVEHVAVNKPSYRGVFSASDDGMLVYQSGGESGAWHLQWADRGGKLTQSLPAQATFLEPAISPDGKRIAVAFGDYGGGGSNIDVWIFDIVRGTKTRLTFDPANDSMPMWTPDGGKIVYVSNRKGKNDLYMKSADGSGSEEPVLVDDSD